ncbi:MAG: hypothetical protein IJY96_04800 [Oscillospiraceae bacterium]|nr:hypothetical protein [Oscillospiraceae bacterium]
MKRLLSVLLMTALVLSGCGESVKLRENFEEARGRWCGAEEISFAADMEADLGDSIFSCGVLCTVCGGETVIELTSPENIAGIRARLGDGETRLEYDGLILALGDAGQDGSSPLGAAAVFAESLLEGHLTGIWTEEEGSLAAADFYVSETEYARLWFERENFVPVHAELVQEGQVVVKCSITNFTKE